MRKREYMRRFTELGQSYRREIERANAERDKAHEQLRQWVDSLVPRWDVESDIATGDLRLLLRVDRHLVESHRVGPDLYEAVARHLTNRLIGAARDYRGDLRQTEGQRALGIPAPDRPISARPTLLASQTRVCLTTRPTRHGGGV